MRTAARRGQLMLVCEPNKTIKITSAAVLWSNSTESSSSLSSPRPPFRSRAALTMRRLHLVHVNVQVRQQLLLSPLCFYSLFLRKARTPYFRFPLKGLMLDVRSLILYVYGLSECCSLLRIVFPLSLTLTATACSPPLH